MPANRAMLARALSLGLILFAPSARAQDADRGARVFHSQCGICHSPRPGRNVVGPSLFGVVGRQSRPRPRLPLNPGCQSRLRTHLGPGDARPLSRGAAAGRAGDAHDLSGAEGRGAARRPDRLPGPSALRAAWMSALARRVTCAAAIALLLASPPGRRGHCRASPRRPVSPAPPAMSARSGRSSRRPVAPSRSAATPRPAAKAPPRTSRSRR